MSEKCVAFLNNLKDQLGKEFPNIKVEIKPAPEGSATYDKLYLYGEGINPTGDFFDFPTPDGLISTISLAAEKAGFEIGSFAGVSQADEIIKWVKANPHPTMPEAKKFDKRTKAGKAAAAKYEADLAQFKVDYQNWLKFCDENRPKLYKTGAAVLYFDKLGHADEVMAFYANTKYWGD